MPSPLLTHQPAVDGESADDQNTADPDVGGRDLVDRDADRRAGGLTPAEHWSPGSLPSRLNREWALTCASRQGDLAVDRWAAPGHGRPALLDLCGVDGLGGVLALVQDVQVPCGAREAVLIGLLERAQDGDRLAGRVVLQTMLPAAVRLACAVVSRPDVLGDRDEAFAMVLSCLWQVIATYPVDRRRSRVTANLHLDMLALVRRGHTSSTHRAALAFPEQSYADLQTVADPGQPDAGHDDPSGPVDAELCTVLAWAVRSAVLRLDEAQLLARVYGLDGDPAQAGPHVAVALGVSWPALRQRCHRLARRVSHALVDSGIDSTVPRGAVLHAA